MRVNSCCWSDGANIEGFSWSRLDPLRGCVGLWVRIGALASVVFGVAVSGSLMESAVIHTRRCRATVIREM